MKSKKGGKSTHDTPASKPPSVPIPVRGKRLKRTKRGKRKKGPWSFGPPFGRDFFERTLLGMVESCPCPDGESRVVRIYLGDGTILDVAGVVSVFDRYAVVAAYEGTGRDGIERTADDLGLEAFPYDLVVRASVRSQTTRGSRFGFGAILPAKPAGPPPPG